MSETKKPTGNEENVKQAGAHDRVTMLRLNSDGSVDQTAPEIIGDKEAALAAARRQFGEQAVSAADVAERAPNPAEVTIVGTPDDKPDKVEPLRTGAGPEIEETQKKLEAAQKAGEAAAEATVKALSSEK